MEKKTDFKALSNKAKVQYIWDYYKLHILFGGVIAAIVIGSGISFYYLPQAGTQRHHDQCPDNQ